MPGFFCFLNIVFYCFRLEVSWVDLVLVNKLTPFSVLFQLVPFQIGYMVY